MNLYLDSYASPLGELQLVTDDQGLLRALDFEDYRQRMQQLLLRHYPQHQLTPRQGAAGTAIPRALDDYFGGQLMALDALPCATGGSDFQRAVWQALRSIQPGTTLTYGALAQHIGRPTASRAVGLANGSNPIAIVVPCHRVIGSAGKLTGYAGGLWRKQWLLEHERQHSRQ